MHEILFTTSVYASVTNSGVSESIARFPLLAPAPLLVFLISITYSQIEVFLIHTVKLGIAVDLVIRVEINSPRCFDLDLEYSRQPSFLIINANVSVYPSLRVPLTTGQRPFKINV